MIKKDKYVNDLNNKVIGFNEPYLKDLEIINGCLQASEYVNENHK